MSVYYMPIIIEIEADSIEEARTAMEDWRETLDIDEELPDGTTDLDVTPTVEYNDDGQRVVYLPATEEDDDDASSDDNNDADDFNDGDSEDSFA